MSKILQDKIFSFTAETAAKIFKFVLKRVVEVYEAVSIIV